MVRRMGAIFWETRPETIIRSAWRGEARIASEPKRAMSTPAVAVEIISMAQQASPNWAGHTELPRPQPITLPTVVVRTFWPRLSTRSSRPTAENPRREIRRSRGPRCGSSSEQRSDRIGQLRERAAQETREAANPQIGPMGAAAPATAFRAVRSVPIEASVAPDVRERYEEYAHEHEHLDEAEPLELPHQHRPRIEEDGLDVEDDEKHRGEVEADRQPAHRRSLRDDAGLVRSELFLGGLGRAEHEAQRSDRADQTENHQDIDQQWDVALEQ